MPEAPTQRPGLFVLVGGWPGSGKTTLARALAAALGLPLLAKDEVKDVLLEAFGQPASVAESRLVGQAAVRVVLRVARDCPSAVVDSTWYDYTRPLLDQLPRRLVEVRCLVPREVAQARYAARAGTRHPGHLDGERTAQELWGAPVAPLGVGALVEVDTSGPVDVPAVARRILAAAASAT